MKCKETLQCYIETTWQRKRKSSTTISDQDLANVLDKINNIRAQLHNIPVETEHQLYTAQSALFQSSESVYFAVKKMILESKSTNCELDFIPTRKLKENIEYFLPAVTKSQ